MTRLRRTIAVVALAVALNGCATILAATSVRPRRPLVYGGVQLDAMAFVTEPYLAPFVILDLPLSAVADTLLLPIAIPLAESESK